MAIHERSFHTRKLLFLLMTLVAIAIIDVSVVKINDLIKTDFITIQNKEILFSVESFLGIILQFFIINQVRDTMKIAGLKGKSKTLNLIPLASLAVVTALISVLIFQQIYYHYYYTPIIICIIAISYGIAASLMAWSSFLFLSWYRINRNTVVLLYFLTMLIVTLNLIVVATFTNIKLSDRPLYSGVYVGGEGDISGGRYLALDLVYRVFSFITFGSLWITTAILMNNYREKLSRAVGYWIVLSLPLIYFVFIYFYEFIVGNLLIPYLELDPIFVSILLSAFLSLSKLIGGVLFGISFWKISKSISYEKNVKSFMMISGWGVFLMFGADQATTQLIGPYPPFGILTVTILNIGGFLMLLGIYNSAILVSVNDALRSSIRKFALESKFLGQIGRAEMEIKIQKTVAKVTQDNKDLVEDTSQTIELDGEELKKYIDFVIGEVNKENK